MPSSAGWSGVTASMRTLELKEDGFISKCVMLSNPVSWARLLLIWRTAPGDASCTCTTCIQLPMLAFTFNVFKLFSLTPGMDWVLSGEQQRVA